MGNKRTLKDNGETIYPITYDECVYDTNGVSMCEKYATKDELNNINTQLDGKTIWTGTQAEYDAITTKDSNTLYFVTEG